MRFMVFGAGALGSLVAARLSGEHDVTLIGRGEHVDAIRERGLTVSGKTNCHTRAVRAFTKPPADPVDVVLVTVKAYDTERAVEDLSAQWKSATFVSLQNGLGNEEVMARSAERVLGAVINQGVTFVGPGEVFHAGAGETAIGPFKNTTLDDSHALASNFQGVGLPAESTPDIRSRIWEKVILNAAVNPLTALLRRRTGELLDDSDLQAAIEDVVAESVEIANAAGASISAEPILAKIEAVARATRDNKSSMLQDLERGRATEIDAINGALVEHAQASGQPAPLNNLLSRLIRSAQRNISGKDS